jgi:hypothetical protein
MQPEEVIDEDVAFGGPMIHQRPLRSLRLREQSTYGDILLCFSFSFSRTTIGHENRYQC